MDTSVLSTLLYACESWTINAEDMWRLNVFELRCYKKIMRIVWTNMMSNQQMRNDLNRAETVIDKVKRRKLQMFERICGMKDNRLIKTVMLGRAEGVRR
jgi:hypothetical protein